MNNNTNITEEIVSKPQGTYELHPHVLSHIADEIKNLKILKDIIEVCEDEKIKQNLVKVYGDYSRLIISSGEMEIFVRYANDKFYTITMNTENETSYTLYGLFWREVEKDLHEFIKWRDNKIKELDAGYPHDTIVGPHDLYLEK